MNTKLTISLNKEVVEQAKTYAKEHNISLSFLIENYLQKIIAEYSNKGTCKGSIVEELSGIIRLNADDDYKKVLTDYLSEK